MAWIIAQQLTPYLREAIKSGSLPKAAYEPDPRQWRGSSSRQSNLTSVVPNEVVAMAGPSCQCSAFAVAADMHSWNDARNE